jgi:hypothetical protein
MNREPFQEFCDQIGGSMRWETSPDGHALVSIEWFQKNILRGVRVEWNDANARYQVVTYASTVKRGQTFQRSETLPDVGENPIWSETLEKGRQLAQSFMEKSFTPLAI